jgi:hypothetical protein
MLSWHEYIQYYRRFHQLSYQAAALKWGVSPRTIQKLESNHPVRPSIVNHVLNTLSYLTWDEEALAVQEKDLETFFRHVLYAKYTIATPLANRLIELEDRYLTSPLIINYVLYIWIFVIHSQNPLIDIDDYYHKLVHLEPFMNEATKELFWVEKTGYFFVKGQLKASFDHFEAIGQTIKNNHYKALSYFLVGASGVNEIQSIDQSIHYLTMAHQIFTEYGNYLRANRCQAFLQIAYIHTRRYDDFLELYHHKQDYFHEDEDVPRMDAFIEGNLARYYVITEAYEKACDTLRAIEFPININYFIYLVAAYQTQNNPDLDRLLNQPGFESYLLNAHHKLFYQALKSFHPQGDPALFLEALKKAVKASENANDYIAYITLNAILVSLLKAHKKYKEAYHYASRELDILRQFH